MSVKTPALGALIVLGAIIVMFVPNHMFANDPDFIVLDGMCGLGRIAAYRDAGQNKWTIELEEVQVLLESPGKANARGKWPAKLTVDLVLQEPLIIPSEQWIGRTAIFVVFRRADRVIVQPQNLLIPLAPDGKPLFVFDPGSDRRPQKIRDFVEILKLADTGEQLRRLSGVVEAQEEPHFLRVYAARQVGRIGEENLGQREAIRVLLARWRDDSRLPLDLRLVVDDALVDISPRPYAWSEARVAFLSNARDAPDSPEYEADVARRHLEQAQKDKEEQNR